MLALVSWHGHASGGLPDYYPRALGGVWAKMRRAAVHYDALTDAAEAYLALPPYQITESYTDDRKILRAVASIEPPEELALILGDLVQNLRSALDHLAWSFARTVRDPPSRLTQFPIMRTAPDDFAAVTSVKHIPPAVRDIMEAMQPYRKEDPVGQLIGRQLATLRELSNRDKHQVLLLAQRLVMPKYVVSNAPDGEQPSVNFDADPDGGWAEISHPLDPRFGPFEAQFGAQVTIVESGLPWRSGLEGIAKGLWNGTNGAINAFRGQWPLLVPPE